MKNYYAERKEKNFYMYTDLAVERRKADLNVKGVDYVRTDCPPGSWESIRIFSEEGARSIGRPCGNYETLNLGRMDLISDDEIYDAVEEVAKKLCSLLDGVNASADRLLAVGLGNRNLTPDSVGPKSASLIKPTMHIKDFDEEMFDSLECSEIAVLCPGVTAESGMEATEIIRGVCRRIFPDAVIAIDSIATRSTERLGTTVQLSDTGLFPGSGIGNFRSSLNEQTLGIPVISIGVPTVIDSRIFAMGDMTDGEVFGAEAMMVSPKEIDSITDVAAKIIGGAVNQAFGICP